MRERLWRLGLRLAYYALRGYWFVARPSIRGAYVALWCEGRVLCVENSYRRRLSLPAGGLKRGESPGQAALRELREEVGVVARAEELHYVGEIVHPAGHAEDHAHVFELHREQLPQIRVDGREVVWAGFLTPDEAIERGVLSVVQRYLRREF